jgi:hypothetical protein
MTADTIKQGYIKHAAMAQLHRWYQIYENYDTTLANQLDILASDIKLKSGLGEGVGHEAYSQRINQLPKTWKNAHLVNGSNFKLAADGTIDLDITLTYLNQRMKPDGSVRSAELTYTTKLKPTANVLPQFSQIEIKQLSEGVAPAFKDAYPENRVLSLMRYWLALIEDPNRNLDPFKEILADGFELQFSSGKINDFQAFEKWFCGPASAVAASTHVIDNFSYELIDKDTWRVQADFARQGLLPDGKKMITKSRHRWTVIDNPQERFARIKTAAVEVLEPFKPKT